MFARFIANAIALTAATFLLSGITLSSASTEGKVVTLAIVAAIFGVVNATVKPILKFFGFPFTLLTFGLFLLVINAAIVAITSWVATATGVGWRVNDFWTALLAAIIISIVSAAANAIFDSEKS